MRDIKFRVWNGIEMVYDVMVGKFGVFYVNPHNNGMDLNDSASLTSFNSKYSDDIVPMQYTGVKDKNGKEIYEGDILSFDNTAIKYVYKVVFENGSYKLYNTNLNLLWGNIERINDGDILSSCGSMEIISNIHENPELLNS